jgi:hypothetical protein
VPLCIVISTDNTTLRAKLKDRKEEEKENDTVLCRATESGPPIRSQLGRHLNYSVCAGALPPQAGKVLPKVIVEVVGGGGIGDEDCKGQAFEFTALELLEPGGQDLAASKGDEVLHQRGPSVFGRGVRERGFRVGP